MQMVDFLKRFILWRSAPQQTHVKHNILCKSNKKTAMHMLSYVHYMHVNLHVCCHSKVCF